MNIVDPYKKMPQMSDLLAIFKRLSSAEKKALGDIKDAEEEMMNILRVRLEEEASIKFTLTVYDTRRNKPTEEEEADLKRKMEEEARARRKKM